ncbi:putative enoyl-CoA hydratase echA8 [Streptomyces sp. YIM 130001]|uniref:enoyl-CoA hydratase/isomerase family protein n=1 Tax=Streptomyces sp. YIM 130001 TaxID=2259644 RepID=UPI000E64E207|nr:enoyl-CoA hydratase/isomerase family protein [Streptomyces sp. YIM 130001]RII13419.1 putative enoyl-CoA hydratase echA8 [Streptomyces sp. YIM 130001]
MRTPTFADSAPGDTAAGPALLLRSGPGHPPVLSGDFDRDRSAVTAHLESAVRSVDAMPPRTERTAAEQRVAAALHDAADTLRRRFLASYADRIYAELTDGLTRSPRLEELTESAAAYFPGLVPTRDRLEAEARHSQRTKEGWEVAVGLFFQAVLNAPTAGNHLLRSMLRPTARARAALLDYQLTGHADLGIATVTRQDGIAQLELRNTEFLNAEDDAATEALETGTDLVLLDPASHVGVLRGAPQTHPAYAGRRVFSAGINLTHLYNGDISLLGFLLRREAGYIAKFVRGLCLDDSAGEGWWPDADKPWVAAVDAFAIGGGMQILPTMDRVVAADDSWFSLPAMEEGLVPGVANMRLLHLTGSRLSRRLIFWGRKLRATDPEASLFVDETVPADAMDGAVRAAAGHLDQPAVGANRRMLNLVEEPIDLFRRYLAQYAYEQARQLHSPGLITTLENTWVNRSRGASGATASQG